MKIPIAENMISYTSKVLLNIGIKCENSFTVRPKNAIMQAFCVLILVLKWIRLFNIQ